MAPPLEKKTDIGSLIKRLPGLKGLVSLVRDLRKHIAQTEAKLMQIETKLMQTEAKLMQTEAKLMQTEAETRLFLELALLEGASQSREEPTPPFGRQLVEKLGSATDYRHVLRNLLRWREQLVTPVIYLARRRTDEVLLLIAHPEAVAAIPLRSQSPYQIYRDILKRRVRRVYVRILDEERSLSRLVDASFLASLDGRAFLPNLRKWFLLQDPPSELACATGTNYFEVLDLLSRMPGLIDFVASAVAWSRHDRMIPFDAPDALPSWIPAEPKRRSALFLNNSYYHFKYLSAALRQRGWDTLTVSFEAPDSPSRQFYHGEDLTIFDPDPAAMTSKIRTFLRGIPERFGTIHFYGQGTASLFPSYFEHSPSPVILPWDFFELRRHNLIIGYMPSGCLDGASQTSIRAHAQGLCEHCTWELHPEVCNDAKNLAWARKLAAVCDVVTIEGDYAVDDRIGPKFVKRPVLTALDPNFWRPDLPIPEKHRIHRRPDELLIYHAFGNIKSRLKTEERDLKGTRAVFAAVDRLKAEGAPVRLFFASELPSSEVRFYQLQSDVVVDQLNYGRFGANAREALMLGKPLVTRLIPDQGGGLPYTPIIESPAMDASEETIYDVLKELMSDPDRRQAMAAAGRTYALKWHAAPVCAERYERMIDRIREGLPPEADELFS
jgi:hypothetical protein